MTTLNATSSSPPAPSSPPTFTIRPFNPQSHDLNAISTISALGNEKDELTLYMRRDIYRYWTSYRASCHRYLRSQLCQPGQLCYVAESTTSPSHEILGWAVWKRHGKSPTAQAWQAPNRRLSKWLDWTLFDVEDKYFKHMPNVDPSADKTHIAQIIPALIEKWPEEVFTDFWELMGMYVHPRHYRKGIGKALVQWGIDQAKRERVCVTVHASPMGKFLYESCGFDLIKRLTAVDVWIPQFKESVEQVGEEKALGAWALVWQYEGGDEVARYKKIVEEEKKKKGTEGKEKDTDVVVEPLEAVNVT